MVFGNDNAVIPERLETDIFLLRPLRTTDVELDYAAVMESREFLRKWEQSTWPEDDFTLAGNLEDLERHARQHINREAFTYTVMNLDETECLGCVYIFPMTARWLQKAGIKPLGDKQWSDYEAVIQFWVRQSRLSEQMDRKLLDALRPWFAETWALNGHLYFNAEQYQPQIALLEAAGLQCQFEVTLPNAASKFRAYSE